MKTILASFLVSTLVLPVLANAGAVSSGGGAPPVPVFPTKYMYQCTVAYSYSEVDQKGIREGNIIADAVFSYDTSDSESFPNLSLDLGKLNWKSVPSTDSRAVPMKVDPKEQRVELSFEKVGGEFQTKLLVVNEMKSETGVYNLSSYDRSKVSFEKDMVIEAKANLEERNNWKNGQQPLGLLVSSTSLKVRCTRVK